MQRVELHLAAGAEEIGFLQLLDDRIGIRRLGARDRFGIDVDCIIGTRRAIDRRAIILLHKIVPPRDRAFRHRFAQHEIGGHFGDGLAADAFEEIRVLALHIDAADRDRHFRVIPLLDENVGRGV